MKLQFKKGKVWRIIAYLTYGVILQGSLVLLKEDEDRVDEVVEVVLVDEASHQAQGLQLRSISLLGIIFITISIKQ